MKNQFIEEEKIRQKDAQREKARAKVKANNVTH